MKIQLNIKGANELETAAIRDGILGITSLLMARNELADFPQYFKIFRALIKTGSMKGVKNGSANIHYDHLGDFKGIEHSYWPWKERVARNE